MEYHARLWQQDPVSLPWACLLRAGRATSNILVLIPPAEKGRELSWYPDTDGLVPKCRETAKQGFLPQGRGASPGPLQQQRRVRDTSRARCFLCCQVRVSGPHTYPALTCGHGPGPSLRKMQSLMQCIVSFGGKTPRKALITACLPSKGHPCLLQGGGRALETV